MADQESSLPLDAFIAGSRKPDGKDLADIEAHLRALEARRAAEASKINLIPGQKRANLEALDHKIAKATLARGVGTEHVRSDPVAFGIYQQENAAHLKAEEEQRVLDAAERQARKEKSIGRVRGSSQNPEMEPGE